MYFDYLLESCNDILVIYISYFVIYLCADKMNSALALICQRVNISHLPQLQPHRC